MRTPLDSNNFLGTVYDSPTVAESSRYSLMHLTDNAPLCSSIKPGMCFRIVFVGVVRKLKFSNFAYKVMFDERPIKNERVKLFYQQKISWS